MQRAPQPSPIQTATGTGLFTRMICNDDVFDKDDLEMLLRTAKRRRNRLELSPGDLDMNRTQSPKKARAGVKVPPLTPAVKGPAQPVFDIEKQLFEDYK